MPSTFLQLVNRVNRKVNEVELTSSNFANATGFYSTAKDAVNDAIRRINQQDFEWPFNHTTYDETLSAGTNRYTYQSDCKSVDYDSFRVQRDATFGNETQRLEPITYEDYLRHLIDDEYNSDTSIRNLPKYVFEAPNSAYGVWPIPDEAYTLTYEYYKLPTDLSAFDDEPTIPVQFDHIIQDGAMVYVYDFRADFETSEKYNRDFTIKLNNMRSIYINKYNYISDRRIIRPSRYSPVIRTSN